MNEIIINKEYTLVEVINLILDSGEKDLFLKIEPGSVLLETKINLGIIYKICESKGIAISCETEDPRGKKIIQDIVYENTEEREMDVDRLIEEEESLSHLKKKQIQETKTDFQMPKVNFEIPKINLPNFNFSFLKESKLLPILVGFWIVLFGGGYFYLSSNVTADIEVFVQAERYVKSLEVRLSTVKNTDVENKIFKGDKYLQNITISKEIETTGKIDSGKKAVGEVTLTNKTDEDLKLKKGSKIEYKSGGKELVYLSLEEVEIPARKLESSSPNVYVNTTKVLKVEAFDYGTSYNLELNKEVTLDGKSLDLVSGVVSKAISGGVKTDIKAVSSDDLKKVYESALLEIKDSFKPAEVSGKVFLRGSEQFTVTKTEYNGKAGDALDKLKITLTIEATGLMYDKKDAENFVKASMNSILPKGFEVYGKELDIEVNLLGKTNSSTLTVEEGDIQLTIKTYKIPVLNTDEIKATLLGKSSSEAESLIKNIPNVIRYNISFNYPVFSSIPQDPKRVNVTISKE
jgi:hypothetical protein